MADPRAREGILCHPLEHLNTGQVKVTTHVNEKFFGRIKREEMEEGIIIVCVCVLFFLFCFLFSSQKSS